MPGSASCLPFCKTGIEIIPEINSEGSLELLPGLMPPPPSPCLETTVTVKKEVLQSIEHLQGTH